MAFLKAVVGTPLQGKAKIRQVNLLDACKELLNVLYINLCIFHILFISIAINWTKRVECYKNSYYTLTVTKYCNEYFYRIINFSFIGILYLF